jgi:4-amino-4-deoxy-L-arabinose transferase-like glycosyltransferase
MGGRAERPRPRDVRAVTRAFGAGRSFLDAHPWAIDAILIAFVTAAAAALRLTLLGDIPYGIHPDEAQLGTDAHKILEGHLIGVYTHAALGQPAGDSYITLPSIWLLGDTAFALRLPLALIGLAAIPLLYLLVRITCARTEAFFASALLAVSYWHLLYSRVAHWSISYGTVLLAAFLCLTLGMRSRRRAWFVAAGAVLGLGVYTYNIYPIAVAAFVLAVGVLSLDQRRGEERQWWRGSVLVLFMVAFVVALPMIVYVLRPYSYYWSHVRDYSHVSVTQTPEYKQAGAIERVRLISEQIATFARAYAWQGNEDDVDASGLRAMFDWLTLALLALGAVIAVRRRREPMMIVALCCVIVIPLPALLQQGSITRQPLGAAPFAMFIAALPLAAIWRAASERTPAWRIALRAGALAVVATIAAITVRDYFWTWRQSSLARFVYHAEITAASDYMRTLPDGTYIYFYSDRHPFDLETRQFLAPHARGVDGSSEFGIARGSIAIDHSGPVVFVLLGTYQTELQTLQTAYPDGHVVVGKHDGVTEFLAYELLDRP